MQINELSHRITSKKLNESLAKNFGYQINLEQFSDLQLEDARNKLRTKISQIEMNESYGSVHESQDYQKTKMFLDVVNQEICEREMTPGEKSKETKIKAKTDPSGMKKSMQKQYGPKKGKSAYFATIRKRAMDHSIPESWISSAISRMHLGESDHAELSAELSTRYDLNESQIDYIFEGEEEKAETIMATKDMVDRVTGWLEDVATMKAEQLLELLDVVKAEHGADTAQRYSDVVKPGLEALYDILEQSRGILNQGLAIVSGEEESTMGAEPSAMPVPGMEPEMGAEPSAMPAMPQSREQRESVDYSRKLGMMLSAQKKK
jgi:hypothetical protein